VKDCGWRAAGARRDFTPAARSTRTLDGVGLCLTTVGYCSSATLRSSGRTAVTSMIPRIATVDDVSALVRLINAAYRVEDFFVRGDRTTPEDVRDRLEAVQGGFLVIDAPETQVLAGAVYVKICGVRGYFAMLSVDPVWQGRGLGRVLVRAVEDHCRAAGCRALDIDVVSLRSELPPFYAGLGFVPSGTAPFPDPGKLRQPAHLVLMTKSLAAQ